MAEKSEVVVKSNRLVEASYRLNLVEQQIILFAISRSRDEQLGLSPDKPVTIAASDFAQAFGTNETKVYGQLKEAMGDLFRRFAVEFLGDGNRGCQAADGVENGGNYATMQPAVQEMADQVGAHGETDFRCRRIK